MKKFQTYKKIFTSLTLLLLYYYYNYHYYEYKGLIKL